MTRVGRSSRGAKAKHHWIRQTKSTGRWVCSAWGCIFASDSEDTARAHEAAYRDVIWKGGKRGQTRTEAKTAAARALGSHDLTTPEYPA